MDLLFVHWNMNPEIFRIGGFAVRWYGLLFVSGFILGYWMFIKFFEREKLNKDILFNAGGAGKNICVILPMLFCKSAFLYE